MDGAKLGDFHVTGRQSNMDGWQLNGASIHNASFGTPQYGIPMRGLSAQNSTWSDVQFNKSDLSMSDFTKASFTRVDMRNVVTPQGPMEMREANLTGLTAGQEAKFTAYKATHSGVTMYPEENFVFRGTAPIQRAAQAALSVRSEVAHIVSADGATVQEREAQQAMAHYRNQQAAPQPDVLQADAADDEAELQRKKQLQLQQMMMKRRQMEMAPSPYNKNKKKDTPW